jgi:hypothetical protein
MNSSIWKKIALIFGAVLLLLQFVQPERNVGSATGAEDISTVVAYTGDVQKTLETSCFDCHSNSTVYPWYASVQPLGLWLKHHVDEGKEELNFTTFKAYAPKRQAHKLDEVIEMLEEGEMPLPSYTLIHKNAVLSDAQKAELIAWAREGAKQIRLANNLSEPSAESH